MSDIFSRMDDLKSAHRDLAEYFESHPTPHLQKPEEIQGLKCRIHEKERLLLVEILPGHLDIKEDEFFRRMGSLLNSVAWGMERKETPRSVPQRT